MCRGDNCGDDGDDDGDGQLYISGQHTDYRPGVSGIFSTINCI